MKKTTAQKIITQTAKNYNLIAKHFSNTRQYNWSELLPFINQYAKSKQTILDIGCGNGRLLKILPSKINYAGIDQSKNLIKEAKKEFNKDYNKNIKFKTGNLLAIKEKDNHFDIVLAIAVLHHIPSDGYRKQAFSELQRVLKPNGILIMSNWNLFQDKYLPYLKQKTIKSLDNNDGVIPWKDQNGTILAQRYCHAFTPIELVNLLNMHNFTTIHNEIIKHNIVTIATKKG